MKVKEFLRSKKIKKFLFNLLVTIWLVSFVVSIVYLFFKQNTVFDYILLAINAAILIAWIRTCIRIREKFLIFFNLYKVIFKDFEFCHKKRYLGYLNGKQNEEETKYYAEMVEKSGKRLLDIGKVMVEDERAFKSERKEIQQIITKTEKMINEIFPSA